MTFVKENQMYNNFGFAILTHFRKSGKKIQTTEQVLFFWVYFLSKCKKVDFRLSLHAVLLEFWTETFLFFSPQLNRNKMLLFQSNCTFMWD